MFWTLMVSWLLAAFGQLSANECNANEFKKCVDKVSFEDSFAVKDARKFIEDCGPKLDAVKCIRDYASHCLGETEFKVFNFTVGGKLHVIEDLCKDGSDYMKNMDCWEMMADDVKFCTEKFEQSLKKITDELAKPKLMEFHTCCAFDWLKQCKMRSVEVRCGNDEAKNYVEKVTNMVSGNPLASLCSSTLIQPISNCYELYGVDVGQIESLFSGSPAFHASIIVLILSLILI